MNINITFHPAKFRTIRKWAFETFDAHLRGNVGQFAVINPYITDEYGAWVGTWSSNQNSFPLTTTQLLRIADLQYPDTNIDAKMNWLMYGGEGGWGAPMQGVYPTSATWRTAQNIRMISACYAGQTVEVVEQRVIRCTFNNVTNDVPMSRIRTFETFEWGAPGSMMLVSVVDANNNYGEMPNPNVGRVMLPIYAGGRQIWLMNRWLE